MSIKEKTTVSAVSLESLAKRGFSRIAVAVGVFDGVHLGHQKLLARLKTMAAGLNAKPVVLTFHPHPRFVLFPNAPLKLLVSREKKFDLLAKFGIDAVVTLPFTADFAAMPPDVFLETCLDSPGIEIAGICVGAKWRFGAEGKGDVETLAKYSKSHNFELDPVEEFTLGGGVVSSTAIRRAVSGGLLDDATAMLGRRHSVRGKVSRGANIATSDLKCPTANIAIPDVILPPDGVYAGFAVMEDGQRWPAAVSVGESPSFKEKQRSKTLVETHLLGFNGDLYGNVLDTEFVRHIREERCFRSPEELAAQIADDLAQIAQIAKSRMNADGN
ncbi:MAG: riboflavin biosynthesis protein RibF [Kiritimatiellaeota bacterium]|nr:riboflavin biosynthesis protein RibF [Kiritimatiellota bacterium]